MGSVQLDKCLKTGDTHVTRSQTQTENMTSARCPWAPVRSLPPKQSHPTLTMWTSFGLALAVAEQGLSLSVPSSVCVSMMSAQARGGVALRPDLPPGVEGLQSGDRVPVGTACVCVLRGGGSDPTSRLPIRDLA